MEILERMFICMEEKDYLQNRSCMPIASCEGENEVSKKSVLYQKMSEFKMSPNIILHKSKFPNIGVSNGTTNED